MHQSFNLMETEKMTIKMNTFNKDKGLSFMLRDSFIITVNLW